jgi:hypothetical protein
VFFQVQDGSTRTLAREIGLPLIQGRDGQAPLRYTTRRSTAGGGSRRSLYIAGALLVIFIAGSLLGASATVTLQQVTQTTSDTLIVTAVVGLSAPSALDGRVPGRLLETEMEANERLPASGERKDPDAIARGSVTFVSRVAENIVVPQGSRVATATGLQFQTMAPATILPPAGSRAAVIVEALTPGTISNVPALNIDRLLDQNLALKVAVVQEQAMTGGTDKEVRLVSNDDQLVAQPGP